MPTAVSPVPTTVPVFEQIDHNVAQELVISTILTSTFFSVFEGLSHRNASSRGDTGVPTAPASRVCCHGYRPPPPSRTRPVPSLGPRSLQGLLQSEHMRSLVQRVSGISRQRQQSMNQAQAQVTPRSRPAALPPRTPSFLPCSSVSPLLSSRFALLPAQLQSCLATALSASLPFPPEALGPCSVRSPH